MKKIFIPSLIVLMIGFISCKDKTIRDLDVATGKVAGQDWTFEKGDAFYGLSEYTIRLMSDKTPDGNVCSGVNPNIAYVEFTIPAQAGIYQMSDFVADKAVTFYEGSFSSKALTAASGYIQIISFSAFTIDGIIQASLDDNNDIAGAFYVKPCN
ncbi:hypothetical protein [Marinoscillum sp. MHG1-6]|uniref:hypothetical protein n=1 Tax=Marinoscillum sp. MHG1-6 TaxID=2959627 RepID=UPI002157F143|nr:hypothetical protein [Marinoscillum sp. MHG1-6]